MVDALVQCNGAMPSTMTASPSNPEPQVWGEGHRFPREQGQATVDHNRFTSGPLAGPSYGSIVGKTPGAESLYQGPVYLSQ